jgi:hypothetical protein
MRKIGKIYQLKNIEVPDAFNYTTGNQHVNEIDKKITKIDSQKILDNTSGRVYSACVL